MKEKLTSSKPYASQEVLYSAEYGYGDILYLASYPERLFLQAEYYSDLSKSSNMRETRKLMNSVFDALKEDGLSEIYCYVSNQGAFNFNKAMGFETTFEIFPEYGIELMKRVL